MNLHDFETVFLWLYRTDEFGELGMAQVFWDGILQKNVPNITLSVLDAINHIPLLSPILELVGVGYSVWFVSRYLLKESTRAELVSEFDSLKEQVFGDGKSS